MATTEAAAGQSPATEGYQLHGTLLEACDCGILCPCWVGEDPDGGTCQALVAYNLDSGTVNGVNVGGLTHASVAFIPGNVLEGNWQIVVFVDDRASDEQQKALLDAFTGKLGGPLADLAQLFGEVKAIERVPIAHEIVEGKGTITIGGGKVHAEMEPYRGPDGTETTLRDSIFSTVPGSPAWVGKAAHFRVELPDHGWTWSFEGRNAIQADWHIDYRGNGAG
jgi:hypothetical protein